MDSPSKFESLAVRFAPYIGDLHEYFVRSGLPFGSPDDVGPFVSAVAVPGTFHDDLCALVRSIIYRENKTINMMEMLEMLLVAVGGPHVDETAADMHESVRVLLDFVRTVYRSLQGGSAAPARDTTVAPAEPLVPAPESAPMPVRERLSPLAADSGEGSNVDGGQRGDLESQLEPFPVRTASSSQIFMRARALAAELEENYPLEQDSPDGSAFDHKAAAQQDRLTDLAAAEQEAQPVSLSTMEPENVLAANDSFTPPVARRPLPEDPPPYRPRRVSPITSVSAFLNRFASKRLLWVAALSLSALVAFAGVLLRSRTPSPTATAPLPAPHHASQAGPLRAPGSTPDYLGVAVGGGTSASPVAVDPDPTEAEPVLLDEPVAAPSASGRSRVAAPRVAAASSQGVPSTAATTARLSKPVGTPTGFASPEPLPKAIYTNPAVEATTPAPNRSSRPERPLHYPSNIRSGAIAVSSGVMANNLLNAPAPEYPRFAKLTRTQGEVVIQAFVARDGSVMATHILRGPYMLRSAAEHAVRRWRYRPYLIDGRATEVATIVSVDFHLHP